MRRLTASFAYLFAAASILLGAQAAAITFDDGLVHVIDAGNSYPSELIFVSDGPGNEPTIVNVLSGGEIATESVSGNSVISGKSVLTKEYESCLTRLHDERLSIDLSGPNATKSVSGNKRSP
jgi:hypothetical protein